MFVHTALNFRKEHPELGMDIYTHNSEVPKTKSKTNEIYTCMHTYIHNFDLQKTSSSTMQAYVYTSMLHSKIELQNQNHNLCV